MLAGALPTDTCRQSPACARVHDATCGLLHAWASTTGSVWTSAPSSGGAAISPCYSFLASTLNRTDTTCLFSVSFDKTMVISEEFA
ncbi:hypothetical protein CGRA01v4_01161 [Colletotrichum graminicola]|nr:hypothetical protein CGRA01v4_01161 [Colletotrichum graminicola]